MKNKDMSEKQFQQALVRHGMKETGFLGYVNINVPGHHIEVSRFNAGSCRRVQLAYLLRQRDLQTAECKCGHMKAAHIHPVKNEAGRITRYSACLCGCSEFGDD